jgi:hypothetical protein
MCWIPFFEIFINIFKAHSIRVYLTPSGLEMEVLSVDKIQHYYQYKNTRYNIDDLELIRNQVNNTIQNYRYNKQDYKSGGYNDL